jgi:hypothetical protein
VTQLISFIAIALGLGVSLASLALRKRVEGGSDAMVKAKQALSSLQAGLLPAEMARFYAGLSLGTEISLGFDFAVLLLACRALQVSVHLGGPYAAPRMVASTAAIANRVCAISERSLAFLTPAYVVPATQQAVIRPGR